MPLTLLDTDILSEVLKPKNPNYTSKTFSTSSP